MGNRSGRKLCWHGLLDKAPSTLVTPHSSGDVFLLCTDGPSNVCSGHTWPGVPHKEEARLSCTGTLLGTLLAPPNACIRVPLLVN